MKKIAIIGGGAAGLAAAVRAAQELRTLDALVQIVVFEASDRIGKSILASGNGRCNFSNTGVLADDYHNADFVGESFKQVPPDEVLSFFHRLGLMWHEEAEGRLYPLANKASAVLDVLRFGAQDLGVEFCLGKSVHAVTPDSSAQSLNRILVSFEDETGEFFDAVILAGGGKIARSVLPPTYSYLNTQPMLASLKTNTEAIKGLNNLRVRCKVSGGGVSEYGEVLFRDYGISGIAVFNISRFVTPGDTVVIDFLPKLDRAQLEKVLIERFNCVPGRNAVDFCAGIFLPAVSRAILKMAGIAPDKSLEKTEHAALAQAIKVFSLEARGVEDYRQAQIRRGGFVVTAFDPCTMQSYADRGLFVVGEALDVDGPCGGYNLHWAWASGILAGRFAAQSLIR